MFEETLSRLTEIEQKFSEGQLIQIHFKTLSQYTYILQERWANESYANKQLIERILENRINKYLDYLMLVDSVSESNEKFIELRGNSVYYLERFMGKKYDYYRKGTLGAVILFGLIIDMMLFWMDLFGDWFIPLVTLIFVVWNRVNYFLKKRKNLVIEDEI